MPSKRKRYSASERASPLGAQLSDVNSQLTVTDDSRPSKRIMYDGVFTPTLTGESRSSDLTAYNLAQHQDSLYTGDQDVDSATDISDTMSNPVAEYRRLAKANIIVDRRETIPPVLATLIRRLFDTPRRAVSPKAGYTAAEASNARQCNEIDAIQILRTAISFDGFKYGGHKFATSHTNVYLDRQFLPQPDSVDIQDRSMQLAQPNLACGYSSSLESNSEDKYPFTTSEEVSINKLRVLNPRTKELCPMDVSQRSRPYFPYFTVQWKSVEGNLWKAAAQGARDGAVINENLRSLFSTARNVPDPTEPDVLLTVHFSSTFDCQLLQLWVHWYDPGSSEYHAEVIGRFIPDEEGDMVRYRRFLRNWQDEAMDSRLRAIKEAIHNIEAASASNVNQHPAPASGATTTASTVPKRPRGRPPKNREPESRGRGQSQAGTVPPSSSQSALRRSSRRRLDNGN